MSSSTPDQPAGTPEPGRRLGDQELGQSSADAVASPGSDPDQPWITGRLLSSRPSAVGPPRAMPESRQPAGDESGAGVPSATADTMRYNPADGTNVADDPGVKPTTTTETAEAEPPVDQPDADDEPVANQPVANQPAADGQPAAAEPDDNQPASGEPDEGQPAADKPASVESTAEGQPVAEQPADDERAANDASANGQPAANDPVTDSLTDDSSAADDEPAADKSVADDLVAGESDTNEPVAGPERAGDSSTVEEASPDVDASADVDDSVGGEKDEDASSGRDDPPNAKVAEVADTSHDASADAATVANMPAVDPAGATLPGDIEAKNDARGYLSSALGVPASAEVVDDLDDGLDPVAVEAATIELSAVDPASASAIYDADAKRDPSADAATVTDLSAVDPAGAALSGDLATKDAARGDIAEEALTSIGDQGDDKPAEQAAPEADPMDDWLADCDPVGGAVAGGTVAAAVAGAGSKQTIDRRMFEEVAASDQTNEKPTEQDAAAGPGDDLTTAQSMADQSDQEPAVAQSEGVAEDAAASVKSAAPEAIREVQAGEASAEPNAEAPTKPAAETLTESAAEAPTKPAAESRLETEPDVEDQLEAEPDTESGSEPEPATDGLGQETLSEPEQEADSDTDLPLAAEPGPTKTEHVDQAPAKPELGREPEPKTATVKLSDEVSAGSDLEAEPEADQGAETHQEPKSSATESVEKVSAESELGPESESAKVEPGEVLPEPESEPKSTAEAQQEPDLEAEQASEPVPEAVPELATAETVDKALAEPEAVGEKQRALQPPSAERVPGDPVGDEPEQSMDVAEPAGIADEAEPADTRVAPVAGDEPAGDAAGSGAALQMPALATPGDSPAKHNAGEALAEAGEDDTSADVNVGERLSEATEDGSLPDGKAWEALAAAVEDHSPADDQTEEGLADAAHSYQAEVSPGEAAAGYQAEEGLAEAAEEVASAEDLAAASPADSELGPAAEQSDERLPGGVTFLNPPAELVLGEVEPELDEHGTGEAEPESGEFGSMEDDPAVPELDANGSAGLGLDQPELVELGPAEAVLGQDEIAVSGAEEVWSADDELDELVAAESGIAEDGSAELDLGKVEPAEPDVVGEEPVADHAEDDDLPEPGKAWEETVLVDADPDDVAEANTVASRVVGQSVVASRMINGNVIESPAIEPDTVNQGATDPDAFDQGAAESNEHWDGVAHDEPDSYDDAGLDVAQEIAGQEDDLGDDDYPDDATYSDQVDYADDLDDVTASDEDQNAAVAEGITDVHDDQAAELAADEHDDAAGEELGGSVADHDSDGKPAWGDAPDADALVVVDAQPIGHAEQPEVAAEPDVPAGDDADHEPGVASRGRWFDPASGPYDVVRAGGTGRMVESTAAQHKADDAADRHDGAPDVGRAVEPGQSWADSGRTVPPTPRYVHQVPPVIQPDVVVPADQAAPSYRPVSETHQAKHALGQYVQPHQEYPQPSNQSQQLAAGQSQQVSANDGPAEPYRHSQPVQQHHAPQHQAAQHQAPQHQAQPPQHPGQRYRGQPYGEQPHGQQQPHQGGYAQADPNQYGQPAAQQPGQYAPQQYQQPYPQPGQQYYSQPMEADAQQYPAPQYPVHGAGQYGYATPSETYPQGQAHGYPEPHAQPPQAQPSHAQAQPGQAQGSLTHNAAGQSEYAQGLHAQGHPPGGAHAQPAAQTPADGDQRTTLVGAFSQAWREYTRRGVYVMLSGVALLVPVLVVAAVVFASFAYVLMSSAQGAFNPWQFGGWDGLGTAVVFLVMLVVFAFVGVGVHQSARVSAEGGKPEFRTAFSGVPVVSSAVVLLLPTFVSAMVMWGISRLVDATGASLPLLQQSVMGVTLLPWVFALPAVLHGDATLFGSFGHSARMLWQNFQQAWRGLLVLFFFNVLGLLVFFIPMWLVTLPTSMIAVVFWYRHITGRPVAPVYQPSRY